MADVGALIDGVFALIMSPIRSIGGIIPNVTIEEVGTDVLRVSDHPVEIGASISDHAYKMPAEIVMRCGWSDSNGGFEGYSAAVYSALLRLQATREPFDVFTGKRLYSNMLIGLLNQVSDESTSDHALVATVGLREVIITHTSAGEASSVDQGSPQQTSSPVNLGLQPLATDPSMPAFTQIPAPPIQ